MLNAADAGSLFHAPDQIIADNPQLASFQQYDDFLHWIDSL